MLKFPDNFWWGSASSGTQTEGSENKINKSVWDYWYETEPERFWNNIGPQKVCQTYSKYKEDADLMEKISLNSFRTSIQWSRLIKNFETTEVDQDAVDFYNNYIDALQAKGIEVVMNLYHFDMPMELQERYGGFESKKVVDMYVLFAKKAFELFGNKVKYWTTFNEPLVCVEGSYLYEFHYPYKKDMKLAVQVAFNMLLSHAKVVAVYKKMNLGGKIGVILNLTPVYACDEASPPTEADKESAKWVDIFFNRSFMDPLVAGFFTPRLVSLLKDNDLCPEASVEEKSLILNQRIDFLGLNYYVPRRVQERKNPVLKGEELMPQAFYELYNATHRRSNPYRSDDEIYPQAIYDMAMQVKKDYGNIKWYIAELGIAMNLEAEGEVGKDGIIDDSFRTAIFKEHLVQLHKAIEDGSNCFGVHQWTFIDNWSWLNSFKRRYGFYRLDLNTGKRIMKKNALFFKEMVKNNGFKK